tara:strand:+ start:230 stop:364 length:135 start_codon:yes stop_codon:yes gene_type:complete
MDSNIKELLYRELMTILQSLEDGDVSGSRRELESLINRIQYNQL